MNVNLNWVLPKWLRKESVPELPENELEETIAKAPEGDRVLRALLQLAGDQWQQANFEALNENLTAEKRQFAAGRASGTMDFLLAVQMIRETRQDEKVQEMKRKFGKK